MSKIQSIRGMNDILPEETPRWRYIEECVQSLFRRYGYSEIRFPVLEHTELFKRSIGEVTDIVEKEMYTFDDRNGDSLTLRPEGTAVCVRACLQHGLLHNQAHRLWYAGPMFRHERPQKGRLRQFQQIGVEAFGMPGPDIDAELILMTARLWQELGVADALTLELNSIGSSQSRTAFRDALVDYLEGYRDQLDEDSQRRLSTNPMRILDSKDASTQAILNEAPRLFDYLDEASLAHFDGLRRRLDATGVKYRINQKLVRGLDYYGLTVFEWTTDRLGAQGTVCAGGRFDGLVEQLGGKPTPAIGFAMGIERLCLLLETLEQWPEQEALADVYVISAGEHAEIEALAIAESVRQAIPGLRVVANCGGGSFKSQFKKADKSGARIALVLGEQELEDNIVNLKFLRGEESGQEPVIRSELQQRLQALFASK